MNDNAKQMGIKIPDEVLKGIYSNMMQVFHTKEEFVLDFMSGFPPQGIVSARVIVGPSHLKRITAALADNLKKYEERFGTINVEPGTEPAAPPSSTSDKKFGF
jgi:hypothetical protein